MRQKLQYLNDHSLVNWVNYAGLENNRYSELAKKYLPKGAGSILTFGIRGGKEAGIKFIENASFMSHLANVGDAKTLIIHPASTTHRQLSSEKQIAAGVTEDMVRISVGLESVDDIIWDIGQALDASNELNNYSHFNIITERKRPLPTPRSRLFSWN